MAIRRTNDRRRRPKQLVIGFWGDSLCQGTGTADVIQQLAYRNRLMGLINAHMATPPKYVGDQGNGSSRRTGVSGLTVSELDATPYATLQLPQWEYDVIFLHIGTNDCTQLQSGGSPLLATSAAAYTVLLDRIRAQWPRCKVYVSRIIDNQTAHTQVVNFNTTILDTNVIARADYLAGLIRIVDEYTAVGLYSATTYQDGSHVNLIGCGLRADAMYASFSADF